jgi:pimeloyl-ACP methyl ester carboxylesterase
MSTVVRPDGTTLAVESLGHDDDPVLLLLGGAGWSRDWWDDELCDRLVGSGLRVVRYDQRDTGESTHWPAGAPAYTGPDLAADTIAILDALGVDRAHLVGLSMGGALAQEIALQAPERVASLTLIATTAVDPRVGDLPGVAPELAAHFTQAAPEPDRSDPAAAVEALVEGERPFAGPAAFDEGRVRALAAAVPGARLLEIEGMGHQLPPPASWSAVIAAVADQTRVASTPQ